MMQAHLRVLMAPALTTVAVLIAPLLPEPLGYWVALLAALLGPGSGVAALLFPQGRLSRPEQLYVSVLASVIVVVGLLSVTSVLGQPLSGPLVAALIAGSSWVTAAGALALRRPAAAPTGEQPDWAAFVVGVATALILVLAAGQLL